MKQFVRNRTWCWYGTFLVTSLISCEARAADEARFGRIELGGVASLTSAPAGTSYEFQIVPGWSLGRFGLGIALGHSSLPYNVLPVYKPGAFQLLRRSADTAAVEVHYDALVLNQLRLVVGGEFGAMFLRLEGQQNPPMGSSASPETVQFIETRILAKLYVGVQWFLIKPVSVGPQFGVQWPIGADMDDIRPALQAGVRLGVHADLP